MLLQVPAQFQFELAQRLDYCRLDVRGGCGVAFHTAVSEAFELFDDFVETADAHAGCAPFASQVLRIAEAFAQFGAELAIVAPVAAHRSPLWSSILPAAAATAAVLRAAGLLTALLLTTLLLTALLLSRLTLLA